MNKSIVLFLAALCLVSRGAAGANPAVDAERAKGEIGQGVICDTVQHVQRFVTLLGTGEDPGAALETVNLEADDDAACQFAFVLYTEMTRWAMCGRLRVGKGFLYVSSSGRGSHVFGLLARFT